jgi:hypothetical protein
MRLPESAATMMLRLLFDCPLGALSLTMLVPMLIVIGV